MNRLIRALRRRRHDDDGISLVEVMVSITVLAIAMAAVASTTISSLSVARDSRESVMASNVAQFELERLRSIPFVDWVVTARQAGGNSSTTTQTVTLDSGVTYEITREVTWVASDADVDGCSTAVSGQGSGADYVRVTQTIGFPGRDLAPVTNTTIITPRLDFYNPETGNLAVIVRDRDGRGAAGHVVQITGLAGTEVATTDRNGCAFFPFLSVDVDDPSRNGYDLEIETADHIDLASLQPAIAETIYVGAQQTAVVEYQYPERAEMALTPTVPATPLVPSAGDRRPSTTCSVEEVAGSLLCEDLTTGNPHQLSDGSGAWSLAIPQDLAWSLVNGNLGHVPHPGQDPDDDLSVDVRPLLMSPLYPFAAGYRAYGGRCVLSSPVRTGAPEELLVASEPGQLTESDIELATVTLHTVARATDTPDLDGDGSTSDQVLVVAPQRDVWVEMRDAGECDAGDRMYLGRSDANGRLMVALPFGTWYVYSRPPGGGGSVQAPPTALPHSCTGGTPAAPSGDCYEVRADYQATQDAEGQTCTAPGTLQVFNTTVSPPTVQVDLTTPCASTVGAEFGYRFVVEDH